MHSNIRQVGLTLLSGLGICGLMLGYWVIVQGNSLLARSDNARELDQAERGRGSILARGGEPLARTTLSDNAPARQYALPAAAHVTGIHSIRLGNTGLEERYDDVLRGAHGDTLQELRHRFLGAPVRGSDVVTTIDLPTQKAAADALGNMTGAIVALDPHSGEVLAMVSQPGFDPNTIERTWETLRQDARAPLLDRAIQSVYPPGINVQGDHRGGRAGSWDCRS